MRNCNPKFSGKTSNTLLLLCRGNSPAATLQSPGAPAIPETGIGTPMADVTATPEEQQPLQPSSPSAPGQAPLHGAVKLPGQLSAIAGHANNRHIHTSRHCRPSDPTAQGSGRKQPGARPKAAGHAPARPYARFGLPQGTKLGLTGDEGSGSLDTSLTEGGDARMRDADPDIASAAIPEKAGVLPSANVPSGDSTKRPAQAGNSTLYQQTAPEQGRMAQAPIEAHSPKASEGNPFTASPTPTAKEATTAHTASLCAGMVSTSTPTTAPAGSPPFVFMAAPASPALRPRDSNARMPLSSFALHPGMGGLPGMRQKRRASQKKPRGPVQSSPPETAPAGASSGNGCPEQQRPKAQQRASAVEVPFSAVIRSKPETNTLPLPRAGTFQQAKAELPVQQDHVDVSGPHKGLDDVLHSRTMQRDNNGVPAPGTASTLGPDMSAQCSAAHARPASQEAMAGSASQSGISPCSQPAMSGSPISAPPCAQFPPAAGPSGMWPT